MQTFESGGIQPYPSRVTQRMELSSRFWLVHAVLPALAFAVLLVAFQELPIDTYVARHWAYDATVNRWLGHGHWWADDLLHTDGRDAILLVIAGLLVTIGGGLFSPRWSAARGTAIYLLATIALAWGLVGLLKHVTNVPCPWSLLGFGGERPHVGCSRLDRGFGSGRVLPRRAFRVGLRAVRVLLRLSGPPATPGTPPAGDRNTDRRAFRLRPGSARGPLPLARRQQRISCLVRCAGDRIWSGAIPVQGDGSHCGNRCGRRGSNACLPRLSSTSRGASFLADHRLEPLEIGDQRVLVDHAHLADHRACARRTRANRRRARLGAHAHELREALRQHAEVTRGHSCR